MKRLTILGCMISVMASTAIPASAAVLCVGESEEATIDIAPGARITRGSERIRYSPAWVDGAAAGTTVIVEVDGEVLSSATGSGFVDWEPLCNGTYTLTHRVMSNGEQIGEALTVVFTVNGAVLCAGESSTSVIDLASGTRTAAAMERIRYSTDWEVAASANAAAVVMVGGERLHSATGCGFVDWTPMSNGTYTLTHKVMSGNEQVGDTLTATFLVAGLAPVYTTTQTTEIPVPYAWLVQYWPTTADEYEAYEAAAKVTAANGRPVWECYVAGLDPTNEASKFTANISLSNSIPYVTWSPNLNTNGTVRSYTIWGKTNLTDGADWECPTNAAHRFFKVTVEMP